MASRFVVADNNVIEELKTFSENSNTRKSTILWVEYLRNKNQNQNKKWAALRNIGEDMETYKIQEFDKFTIIAQFLVKLKFNFTCVFKVSKIALVALRLGQFVKL